MRYILSLPGPKPYITLLTFEERTAPVVSMSYILSSPGLKLYITSLTLEERTAPVVSMRYILSSPGLKPSRWETYRGSWLNSVEGVKGILYTKIFCVENINCLNSKF